MDKSKQDILNKDTFFEYYVNFSDYTANNDSIIFESRFSTFYKKPIVYIDDKILAALSQLKQEHIPLLKSRLIYNRKLQDIADENSITRERVRQIEEQNIKKFFVVIDRSIVINIIEKLSEQPVLFLDDIPIKDTELKLLFCNILSFKKSRKALFDKEIMALVQNSAYSFAGLVKKIEHYLKNKGETLFLKDRLEYILQSLLPKVENIKKVIQVLERENIIRKIDNDQYFFPFLYKPKRPMLEFIFSLYPEGLELHKEIDFIIDELNKFFPGVLKDKDKKRAITALVGFSDEVLLWDWGRYLHIKYINPILNEYDFNLILNHIDENLNNTQIDLQATFEIFKKELIDIGITSKYALHTCLKLKYPEEYSYQDSPWISKIGIERSELKETLKKLMIENRNYSLNELVEAMHTNKVRVQQLVDNTNDIVQVSSFQYRKKKFIEFSGRLFDRIVQYIDIKVKELDFIYIELIIDEFSEELNIYNQYDLRMLLLELLKKDPCDKNFNISNTRIVNKSYPMTRESLNFHILIENLLKDKNTISINEIANYFTKRGLSKDRIMIYYRYSKVQRIVRLDQETFMSVVKLGLTQKYIENINLMLEDNLSNEAHIDDILMHYKLPKISVEWNRFILTDITDYNKFIFSPSRENPIYIAKK